MDDLVPYRLRSPDADASCRFLRTVARSVLRQYRNAHSRRLSRLTEEAAQFCIYHSVSKVSVLIFYLSIFWTYLKLQVISFEV